MSVYTTPPRNPREFLEFLSQCVEGYMALVHDDWFDPDIPNDDELLIGSDPYFASGEYGVGMIVGPFKDGDKLYSFVVKLDGITVIE
jgi:hypothetical protein